MDSNAVKMSTLSSLQYSTKWEMIILWETVHINCSFVSMYMSYCWSTITLTSLCYTWCVHSNCTSLDVNFVFDSLCCTPFHKVWGIPLHLLHKTNPYRRAPISQIVGSTLCSTQENGLFTILSSLEYNNNNNSNNNNNNNNNNHNHHHHHNNILDRGINPVLNSREWFVHNPIVSGI